MAVTITNLIQGPGTLYFGARYNTAYTTTAEPADSAVNSTPAASGWTDVGGTQDGVNLEISREFAELEVDQIIDTPDRRQTKRELSITTNLAEPTLDNIAVVSNEDTANVTSNSGYDVYEPDAGDTPGTQYYRALIFDGYAPGQFRRRVIARRTVSVDPTAIPYKKDGQTLIPVKWAAHYVSSSLKPFKMIDQTA